MKKNSTAKARYTSIVRPLEDDITFSCTTRNMVSIPHLTTACDCICEEKRVYVSLEPQETDIYTNK